MPSIWPFSFAALADEAVIGGERRADRAAGIAGRRLDPDASNSFLAQHLAVGDAVQRDAAGEAEVLGARFPSARAARQPQHDLFGDGLHRGREIHVALGRAALRACAARRRTARRTARSSCAGPVQ